MKPQRIEERRERVEVTVIKRIDQRPPLRFSRKVGRTEVSLELYRGRPQVRLRDERGGWFVFGLEDAVDISKAIDGAVSAYVAHETAADGGEGADAA